VERKMGTTKNPWRYVVLAILFIIWIAFSFAMYNYLAEDVSTDWWIFAIPISVIWLVYVGIAYVLTRESYD